MATTGSGSAAGSEHHPEIDWVAAERSPEFRDLIKKMCDGTNDPNCVYGAQRDNRER